MTITPVRFSQNYLERGEPVEDSARMRVRLSQSVLDIKIDEQVLATALSSALGCQLRGTANSLKWKNFYLESTLRDLLDSHTVIVEYLNKKGYRTKASQWVSLVERIFREENLCYTINEIGEVHFAQDAEFQRNRLSALKCLSSPRYRAALSHFEAAQSALDRTPRQTREAIRQTYEAIETVFRLIFPEAGVLGPAEVEKKLRPLALGVLAGTERDCLSANVTAFKDWVIGAQGYRHGKGTEEPDNPSLSTTVLCVSAGASYLRWLLEIDAIEQAKNQTTTGI